MNADRICVHRWNFWITNVEGFPLTFADLANFVAYVELKREEPFSTAINSVVDHHFSDEARFIEFEENPFRFL